MNASVPGLGQEKVSNANSSEEVINALEIILKSGQITELRALEVSTADYRRPHVVSGYFDNSPAMVRAASAIFNAKGIYFIPNPINPALLARAMNRVHPVEKEPLTSDADILSRRWLPIDADPVRPSGISSSEMEHEAALEKVREIRDALTEDGWPAPILADSGNGGHALYRIELPAHDGRLVKQALEALALRFDSPEVTLDQKVFNAARIWKLYGTMARKGDDTVERPHRLARLLEVPSNLTVVPKKLLEKLAAVPRSWAARRLGQPRTQRGAFDLACWIEDRGLEVEGSEPWQGGRRWVFPVCPWNPNHRNRSAYIVQQESGAISAGCHHNSCNGKGWEDLRYLYEPELLNRPKSADSRCAGEAPEHKATQARKGSKPEVTVPGEHDGIRFGHDQLALAMRVHLPLGVTLFRRGTELVRLVGEPGKLRLHPLNPDALRGLVDQCAELIRIKTNKSGENTKEYRPCSKDLAAALLAALSCDPAVPECETIAEFPAWVRTELGDWHLPQPGYDADARHFFDAPPELVSFSPLTLDPDCPADRKLVCDILARDKRGPFQHFPWANRASEINVLAAELTILMRPGIRSPVPMIAITAPLPRCGKGLLVDAIWRIATGKEVCVHPLPQNEEEISKGLLSTLRKGAQVILFDNAAPGRTICSGTLAAFVTSGEFGGRLLGHSNDVSYPNRTVVFLTGNNLALSRELALRALPVELLPANANPEARTGLPNLPDLVARERLLLLSLLHGMVEAWVRMGMPPGHVAGLGGFEDWAAAVGGVLGVWGLMDQLGGNLLTWRTETDTETSDVGRFLLVWQQAGGEKRDWSARELLALARRDDLFPEVFARKEHGQLVAFSKSVIKPLVEVPREIPDERGNRRKFRVIRTGSESSHRGFQYRLDLK
jgi:hypothetical protein